MFRINIKALNLPQISIRKEISVVNNLDKDPGRDTQNIYSVLKGLRRAKKKKKIFDDSKSETITFSFISLLALLFMSIRERKTLCHEKLDILFFLVGSR